MKKKEKFPNIPTQLDKTANGKILGAEKAVSYKHLRKQPCNINIAL